MPTEVPLNNDSILAPQQLHQSSVLPVLKEVIHVSREVVETGTVKAIKRVEHEKKHVSITLANDELLIERVPIGRFVDSAPAAVRYEGDTVVIPVLKEEYVKRILIVEEVRITKRSVTSEYNEEVTLRREQVEVKRENTKNKVGVDKLKH